MFYSSTTKSLALIMVFKAAVHRFCLFVATYVWKPGSYLRNYLACIELYSGTAPAEVNMW